VAMGADKQQMLKAFKEAEAYNGPSLVICYAPCINQGIKKGMGKTQHEQKLAVDSGYWPLYRYNPQLAEQGENPFKLESKAPDGTLQEFLSGENRYAMLERFHPELSKAFREKIEKDYADRYATYAHLAEADYSRAGDGDLAVCETGVSAESPGSGEPCDDGR